MTTAVIDATGRVGSEIALIGHRDAAEAGLRALTDPALWGARTTI